MDYSPPDSSDNGTLQARIQEWVAISFSTISSQPRDQKQVPCTAGRSLPAEPAYEHIYIADGIERFVALDNPPAVEWF